MISPWRFAAAKEQASRTNHCVSSQAKEGSESRHVGNDSDEPVGLGIKDCQAMAGGDLRRKSNEHRGAASLTCSMVHGRAGHTTKAGGHEQAGRRAIGVRVHARGRRQQRAGGRCVVHGAVSCLYL